MFSFLFLADLRWFYSQINTDKKNQRSFAFFICADQREIIVCFASLRCHSGI